ncbi:MAG: hypothetical protein ACRDYX_21245 [Egibacteraceae bacterium]
MRLIERPPATPRRPGTCQPWEPPGQRHPAVRPAGLLFGVAWRWRVELAAAPVAITAWMWLAVIASRPAAAILTAGQPGWAGSNTGPGCADSGGL